MTVGEIVRTGITFLVLKGLSKTATAITKGTISIFDTDGWGPAGAAAVGPHGIPMETVAAGAGQEVCAIMVAGNVNILKAAGVAYPQGTYVESDASGAAVAWTTVGTVKTEVVGLVTKSSEAADTEQEVLLVP